MRLSDDQLLTLRDAVSTAVAIPDLVERITAIYADVQQAIDARNPRCDISGRCCQFEKFGHLLFVTTAELAVFQLQRPTGRMHGESPAPSPLAGEGGVGGVELRIDSLQSSTPPLTPPAREGEPTPGCPYQIAGKCSVHTIRPFGCRIYFCDPTAQDWQQDQYEQFHTRLKQLHDELSIPYLYVEWRQGLKALARG